MRYRVTIPNWYSGEIRTEIVEGKEVVIYAPPNMVWAVGKDMREVSAFYRARTGGTVEPISGRKIVRRKKRTVRVVRRKKGK